MRFRLPLGVSALHHENGMSASDRWFQSERPETCQEARLSSQSQASPAGPPLTRRCKNKKECLLLWPLRFGAVCYSAL